MREAIGQSEEPEAVSGGEVRSLDLAEDDELLAEQGILSNQVSFTEREIGCGTQEERRVSWLGQTTEGLIQE